MTRALTFQKPEMDMARQGSLMHGVALATLAAGPAFLTAATLGAYCLQIPRPIAIAPQFVFAGVLLLIPATVIGALVSVVPNLLGAIALARLADRLPPLRTGPAWTLIGAALAFLLFRDTGASEAIFLFPATATGALCATLCRHGIWWAEV